jgi:PKD repeat protein
MCKKWLFLLSVLVLSLVYTTGVSAGIVYVDATQGEGGNTALATGEVLVADDPGTVGSGSDNLWRGRGYANEGSILESAGDWSGANPEDCPRLVTTVDVPEGSYDVYVYMWGADAGTWRMAASLENSEGDLPVYICNDPNGAATLAVAEDFAEPVPLLAEDNRTLWQVYLGAIDTTEGITVYIDDDPTRGEAGDGGNARTWYDGIGYEPVTATEPAPKIVWVSEWNADANGVPFDQGWIDLLAAQGYEVDANTAGDYTDVSEGELATLEAADLIIVSRNTNSGNYCSDVNEVTLWNSVETPLILMSAYLTRTSKWQWIDSGTTNQGVPTTLMDVIAVDHPIFEGVTTEAVDSMNLAYVIDDMISAETTEIASTDAGNGTLLSTRMDNGNIWIAEWEAGVTGYEGTDQVLAGKRLYFAAGGGQGQEAGVMSFNEDGQTMFLNAVEYMLPSEAPPAALLINGSFELPGTDKMDGFNGDLPSYGAYGDYEGNPIPAGPETNVPGWTTDDVTKDCGIELGVDHEGSTDGDWIAYLRSNSPVLWQLTEYVIEADDVIVFSVDSVNHYDGDTQRMTVYYDNEGTRVAIASVDNPVTDDWQTFTLTTDVSAVPEAVGKQLGVELSVSGTPGPWGSWIMFDNAVLEVN